MTWKTILPINQFCLNHALSSLAVYKLMLTIYMSVLYTIALFCPFHLLGERLKTKFFVIVVFSRFFFFFTILPKNKLLFCHFLYFFDYLCLKRIKQAVILVFRYYYFVFGQTNGKDLTPWLAYNTYSCNNITTTLIQISCLFLFWLFLQN